MTPRIKIIVTFKLTLTRVCRNKLVTFWPGSTGLDHAWVVSIWVKSQTTNEWSRPVEAGRSIAHLFRQTRSKVSLKVYYHNYILWTLLELSTFILQTQFPGSCCTISDQKSELFEFHWCTINDQLFQYIIPPNTISPYQQVTEENQLYHLSL